MIPLTQDRLHRIIADLKHLQAEHPEDSRLCGRLAVLARDGSLILEAWERLLRDVNRLNEEMDQDAEV